MRKVLALWLPLLFSLNASALEVGELWARASAPGAKNGAVYGRISNPGGDAVRIGRITSAVAGHVMLHRTVTEDGMTRMRHAQPVELAPGESVVLEPGGLHIMLMGLVEPLVEGGRFDIGIETSTGDVTTVPVRVGGLGQMTAPE